MTKEQILNDPKLAIHCPTQEEADKLRELLGPVVLKHGWKEYGKDTCFCFYNVTRFSLNFAKGEGYNIIPASTIIADLRLFSLLSDPEVVVHCKAEQEANILLKWADAHGFKWDDGCSYLEDNYYNENKSETCYNLGEGFCGARKDYSDDGYIILTFDSIKQHFIEPKQIIANLQPGTKVRVRPDLTETGTYHMHNNSEIFVMSNYSLTLYANRIVTITTTVSGKYKIREGGYSWVDEMFSEIISLPEEEQPINSLPLEPKYKIGDYVTLSPSATHNTTYNGVKFTNFLKFSEPLQIVSFDRSSGIKYLLSNKKAYGEDILVLASPNETVLVSEENPNPKPSVAPQEPTQTKQTKKDTIMAQLKQTALVTVDQNKQAAIIAAKMEAGRILNKQVIKLAKPHVPMLLRGYLDTPLAPVILANAVAMLGNHTGNQKVQKVSELMILAAADVTVQSFNLDKIIDDVLSGVKLPKGILDSDEE